MREYYVVIAIAIHEATSQLAVMSRQHSLLARPVPALASGCVVGNSLSGTSCYLTHFAVDPGASKLIYGATLYRRVRLVRQAVFVHSQA